MGVCNGRDLGKGQCGRGHLTQKVFGGVFRQEGLGDLRPGTEGPEDSRV